MLGQDERANDINQQLQELEERANELDKRRSGQAIQLVSYINSRNRRRNVEEAEKAIIEEARANKGLKISDPFTRRSTKPKMAFKANQNNAEEEIMVMQEAPKPSSKQKEKKAEEHLSADNLYSLHDFEIDLDVPLPTNAAVLPKPVQTTQIQDSGPKVRRSLNLEDYKKKRGLI